MTKELKPERTKRAKAFELWMKAPMPMVTFFKTFDVTRLITVSGKLGYKSNMLPVGDKFIQYDRLAINTVVATQDGDINSCDIPFSDDLEQFNRDYLHLTKQVHDTCECYHLDDAYMMVGTSTLAKYEIDGAVNIYTGIYNNPFLIWGSYRKQLLRTLFSISFQFHHTQMDGGSAAQFLTCLQDEINQI